jgi:RND superfamily putative drug exporter
LDDAAAVLREIDAYYADVNERPEAVATQLARQLSDPKPRDSEVTGQLSSYRELDERWHDWTTVMAVLAELAERMTR